jgi:hypothetical protein
MFEHLGWMTMAQKHHNQLKIDAYMEGIKRLHECLESKLRKTHDADRRDDLRILIENTVCLKSCAHALLSCTTEEDKSKCDAGEGHKATNCGLAHWMKKKFEMLGWMCLAMDHGHHLKVKAYLDSIQRLKASLEMKIGDVHEADRKDDLKILHEDVCILQGAAHKLLTEESHRAHMHHSHRHSSRHHYHTKKATKH